MVPGDSVKGFRTVSPFVTGKSRKSKRLHCQSKTGSHLACGEYYELLNVKPCNQGRWLYGKEEDSDISTEADELRS